MKRRPMDPAMAALLALAMQNLSERDRARWLEQPELMAEWFVFRRQVYGVDLLPGPQDDECRRCFLAGMTAGFNALNALSYLRMKEAIPLIDKISKEFSLIPLYEFPSGGPTHLFAPHRRKQ